MIDDDDDDEDDDYTMMMMTTTTTMMMMMMICAAPVWPSTFKCNYLEGGNGETNGEGIPSTIRVIEKFAWLCLEFTYNLILLSKAIVVFSAFICLKIHVHQVVGLLLFVPEEEQFICCFFRC